MDIDVIDITDLNKNETHTVITQAGLRYAQANALIEAINLIYSYDVYKEKLSSIK